MESTKIVDDLAEEGLAIWNEIQPFKINTKEDIEIASEMIVEAKSRLKILDEKEKEITAPMNAALKAARDLFRAPKKYFADIEAFFKQAIATHAAAELERNRKAIAAASASFAEGDNAQASVALSQVTDLKNTAGAAGVNTREVWDFIVEDVSQLPKAYLLPNEKLIRHDMSSGKRDLPGVRYFKRVQVAARTK